MASWLLAFIQGEELRETDLIVLDEIQQFLAEAPSDPSTKENDRD
ncbi:hypothetical protein [Microbacterium aurantiacum]